MHILAEIYIALCDLKNPRAKFYTPCRPPACSSLQLVGKPYIVREREWRLNNSCKEWIPGQCYILRMKRIKYTHKRYILLPLIVHSQQYVRTVVRRNVRIQSRVSQCACAKNPFPKEGIKSLSQAKHAHAPRFHNTPKKNDFLKNHFLSLTNYI